MSRQTKRTKIEKAGNQGWWDEQCRRLSRFLWLPTKATLKNLQGTSSNLDSVETLQNSWFTNELHSLPFSSHEGAEQVQKEAPYPVLRSKKIRLYPTAEQQELLMQWFGTSRYVYNKTVEFLMSKRNRGIRGDWLEIKRWLLKNLPEWAQEVPYQIKAVAIRDACQNVKSSGEKIKFRSRRDGKQTIFIPKSSITPGRGVYWRLLGEVKHSGKIPEADGDGRLTYENGCWFVSVPIRTAKQSENQGRVVSVDPGIRTFMTFYSLDSCGKLGTGAFSRIFRLCRWLDDLNCRMKDAPHHKRYKMRKAAERLNWDIKNLIEELHHKTALFLVKNFDVIVIPSFKFTLNGKSERFKQKFCSTSLKRFLEQAHPQFQEFLRAKALEYDRQVIVQDEGETSKICSWNGESTGAAGRAKFIRDQKGTVVDRDYNGARGILLRALRESAFLTRM